MKQDSPKYPWECRPKIHQRKQRTRFEPFLWSIATILALALGIYAGAKVTKANKDTELMDLQAQLETANAGLADANIELAFWKTTMKGLAEGEQLTGSLMKERVSDGD